MILFSFVSFIESLRPPEDISVNGHLIDELFTYITMMNIFFFILVCIGLFGFSYLYRAKKNPIAHYSYGTSKRNKLVTLIIAGSVFIMLDLNITRIANDDFVKIFGIFPDEKEEDLLKIQVMAQQWMWNFRYAGLDGRFNTEDDIITVNDLRVPIGKKIFFQIISKDVIHSFFIPNTRRKVDAIPGRITRLWFELKKEGEYEIACAEMCGVYHYRMKALLQVYSQDNFKYWMEEAAQRAKLENDLNNEDIFWGWEWKSFNKTAPAMI